MAFNSLTYILQRIQTEEWKNWMEITDFINSLPECCLKSCEYINDLKSVIEQENNCKKCTLNSERILAHDEYFKKLPEEIDKFWEDINKNIEDFLSNKRGDIF